MHIEDVDDSVVNAVNDVPQALPLPPAIKLALAAPTYAARLAGNVYTSSSALTNNDTDFFGVHGNAATYTDLSTQLWRVSKSDGPRL